jgi:hypothetical protein
MTTRKRRPRGRPTKATTTALIDALTRRQVALASQRARAINQILASHIDARTMARLWVGIVAHTRKRMLEDLPLRVGQALPAYPTLPGVVRELATEALEELKVTDEDRRLAAMPSPPPERRAIVPTPQNYAHARAVAAGLAARLMTLRARIARPARSR